MHDGRVLLVRRSRAPWPGCWDVPGGFCGPDEHPIATAERELLEETGLVVRVTGLLGMWLDAYDDDPRREAPKLTLNIYYHARPVGAVSLAPDAAEVAEAGWFAAEALPPNLAFPRHIVPVLAAWRRAVRAGATETPLPDRPA
jgi:ADP-ribose pyrophosphatase YjhB (NUDIX family)